MRVSRIKKNRSSSRTRSIKNSENLMEKQYKTTNGFTNATNLKLFVAYRIAIIKSQDLGKTKNEKRLRFYENNWQ